MTDRAFSGDARKPLRPGSGIFCRGAEIFPCIRGPTRARWPIVTAPRVNAQAALDETAESLLREFAAGEASATQLAGAGLTEVLPQVYADLRRMAAGHLQGERTGHTLQPTDLVHEVWLRLAGQRSAPQNRAHFLALAARMMRRILATHAVRRGAQKRGSGADKLTLSAALELPEQREAATEVVHDALTRLEQLDARQAHIAELRFFGGLNVDEVAEVLAISPATVKREWSVAKLWLRRELAKAELA
ncbi:MAG: sigma-70 family RNA polymerase sigma factor [Verrucomicrobia bacterium]|nr:sigma-70 family RNA polymerase sigma factor [Verrucomicrobiota bacterium]